VTIRPFVFWPHLAAGVLTGLVILMMSATGLVLTYERQIVAWVDRQLPVVHDVDRVALTVDELRQVAAAVEPGLQVMEMRFQNDPESAVFMSVGQGRDLAVDPYTGAILRDGESSVAQLFDVVTELHRWFALEGEAFDIGRAVTAYSNLLFLFLMLSGIYLWLPRRWSGTLVRTRIFFNPRVNNAKARDFNWHHVFSFWFVIPLMILSATATIFYFPWANEALYASYGEDVPERDSASTEPARPGEDGYLTQQQLLEVAQREATHRGVADWRTIWMELPEESGGRTHFYIDRSIGGQPARAYELSLDATDGSVVDWSEFADESPGNRARTFVRYLHTGEVFGFIGQTVAGLASLAACLLVYTGLTLAWRRLVQPLLRRS
jgi:uncharacterized iron-regulated membrane protein